MQPAPEPRHVERSVELPIEPESAWELLVDDEERADWFGGPTTLPAEPGAPTTFTDPDGTRRAGRVDAVDEGRELAWTWWPEDGDGDGDDASRVVIRLIPSPVGTRVTVTETQLSATRVPTARAGARLLDLELVVLLRSSLLLHV